MPLKTLLCSLVLGLALPAAAAEPPAENPGDDSAPPVETATPSPQPAATKSLTEGIAGFISVVDEHEQLCFLPVPSAGSGLTRRYEFTADGSPCSGLNDRAWSVMFEDLPSATEILLTDSRTCKTTGSSETIGKFWVKLRTTKKVTITEEIQLPFFFRFANNKLIKPGLLLVDKHLQGDSVDALDALSCITVTTSRATRPKPVEPITFTDLRYEQVTEHSSKFKCGENRVMLGREASGTEKPTVRYLCGVPMQGTREVVLKNQKMSPSGMHGVTHEYVCPLNTLMTGREQDGDHLGESRYWCAEAWIGEERLEVLTLDHWWGPHTESGHAFSCTGNTVMAGMSRYGREDTKTWYRCASLFQLSPP